jgi:transcription elongation GreA/GreB family factor
MGEQLLGRKHGDTLELNLGGKRNKYRIASVG